MSNNNNNQPTVQRIPVENRTTWMFDRHLSYGIKVRMTNLDQFGENSYLEYETDENLSHVAEFKNEREKIEMWNWNIKAQANLASRGQLPFFVVVGFRNENCFWIIPANQIAKNLSWTKDWCNKWISERNYVRILYSLRQIKPDAEFIKQFDATVPTTNIEPNIEW